MTKEQVTEVVKALEERKAENVKVIDISKVSVMTDYFVITNGNSQPQLDAIIDAAEEALNKLDIKYHLEGSKNQTWNLIDAGDLVIHVFNRDSRSFYNVEHLWKDGEIVEFNDIL